MKTSEIKTFEDSKRYIEGCLNDLETGINTKAETILVFLEYTLRIAGMAIENTQENAENLINISKDLKSLTK